MKVKRLLLEADMQWGHSATYSLLHEGEKPSLAVGMQWRCHVTYFLLDKGKKAVVTSGHTVKTCGDLLSVS
jgi:hypothetical protein